MSVDQELIQSLEIQLKAAKEGRLKAILMCSMREEIEDGEAQKAGATLLWGDPADPDRGKMLVFCADQIKRENKEVFKAAKQLKALFDVFGSGNHED